MLLSHTSWARPQIVWGIKTLVYMYCSGVWCHQIVEKTAWISVLITWMVDRYNFWSIFIIIHDFTHGIHLYCNLFKGWMTLSKLELITNKIPINNYVFGLHILKTSPIPLITLNQHKHWKHLLKFQVNWKFGHLLFKFQQTKWKKIVMKITYSTLTSIFLLMPFIEMTIKLVIAEK